MGYYVIEFDESDHPRVGDDAPDVVRPLVTDENWDDVARSDRPAEGAGACPAASESILAQSVYPPAMSPTVHERRNAIRAAVGRFERDLSATFTKEELAAIATALGADTAGGSAAVRASIRWRVGLSASVDTADSGPFVTAELRAIADAVGADAAGAE